MAQHLAFSKHNWCKNRWKTVNVCDMFRHWSVMSCCSLNCGNHNPACCYAGNLGRALNALRYQGARWFVVGYWCILMSYADAYWTVIYIYMQLCITCAFHINCVVITTLLSAIICYKILQDLQVYKRRASAYRVFSLDACLVPFVTEVQVGPWTQISCCMSFTSLGV